MVAKRQPPIPEHQPRLNTDSNGADFSDNGLPQATFWGQREAHGRCFFEGGTSPHGIISLCGDVGVFQTGSNGALFGEGG